MRLRMGWHSPYILIALALHRNHVLVGCSISLTHSRDYFPSLFSLLPASLASVLVPSARSNCDASPPPLLAPWALPMPCDAVCARALLASSFLDGSITTADLQVTLDRAASYRRNQLRASSHAMARVGQSMVPNANGNGTQHSGLCVMGVV